MNNQGIDITEKYPKFDKNIEWTTQVATKPSKSMKWIGDVFVEERRGNNSQTWSKEGINMDWARNWAGIRKNLSHVFLWDKIFQTNYADNLDSVVLIDKGKEEKQIYNHIVRRAFDFGIADTGLITFNPDEVETGLTLDDALYSNNKSKNKSTQEESSSVEASSLFDGDYNFRLFRSSPDGSNYIGYGSLEIINGKIAFNENISSSLDSGTKDLYKTFEGSVDKDGKVIGSVKLSVLFGKNRSEVYYLSGPIEKIIGESPDEDFFKVSFSVKKAK